MAYYLGGNFDLNGADVSTSKYHSTCHPQQTRMLQAGGHLAVQNPIFFDKSKLSG